MSDSSSTSSIPLPSFRRAQWRTLLVAMFCYLFYYTGRQNYGWAIPGIKEDLNLTQSQIGLISGMALAMYGIGQFISGNLADKYGSRVLVTVGAAGSFALNWVTSFAQSFWGLILPWSANSYFQSMGYAPATRLLANWFRPHERGFAFGLFTFAAGLSSAVTYALSIGVLQGFDWRYVFRLPVFTLLIGGLVFYCFVRDRPEDLGYPPIVDPPTKDPKDCGSANPTMLGRYRNVLGNPRLLFACASIGFAGCGRFGLLTWVPSHFLSGHGEENSGNVWVTLAAPLGMAIGPLFSGYLSDRFFGSNRSRVITLFLVGASIVTLPLYFLSADQVLLGMAGLFFGGFFIFGTYGLFATLCPDLVGVEQTGTAAGIMSASSYFFAAFSEPFIGKMIQVTGQTETIFLFTSAVCLIAAVFSRFVGR